MDPIDKKVGKADEEGKLEDVVQPEGRIGRRIVQFGVPPHFTYEEWDGKNSHDGKSEGGLFDLKGDLILEVLRMGEGGMVEDKVVRKGSANKVYDEAEEPGVCISIHARSQKHRLGDKPCDEV